jgi:hypothetical protein
MGEYPAERELEEEGTLHMGAGILRFGVHEKRKGLKPELGN